MALLTRAKAALGKVRANLPARRPSHYLAVCGIFRNEGRYIAEWVEFHRRQGVDRFWLYDNLSTDDWRSELDPWLVDGVVTVTPWPDVPGQYSAYSDCLKRHRKDARWIALIDIDEFLFSPTGRPLPEVLRGFEHVPAVVAAWRVYGTNGHVSPPPGLVVENYLRRFPDDHPVNAQVKSIVNPRKTSSWVENAHVYRHYGRPVAENGEPFTYHDPFGDETSVPLSARLLRINHYVTKSQSEMEAKLAGRRVDTAEVNRDRSPQVLDLPASETVEDRAALESWIGSSVA
jgi:hypothetical protein